MSRETTTSESGFTLVELLIAITISGIIVAALSAGFLVALKGTAGAHERFMGSNASQTFATYFASDVQSADPLAIRTDSVETGCAPSPADTGSSNVVRLTWAENAGDPTSKRFFASYRAQQSGTEWQLVRYFCLGRVADDATASGTNLTSAKAAFTLADIGSGVSGTNIPTGTKINNVSGSTVQLNQAPTGPVSTVTIEPAPSSDIVAHDVEAPGQRFTDGVTNGTTTFTSAGANFTPSDNGRRITGTNIPVGTTITYVSSSVVTMSAPATGTASNITFTVGRPPRPLTDGVTSSGSKTLTSATAAFGAGDVGRALTGANIPSGTTIASVTNATTVTMSSSATGSGSALAFAVGAPYAVVSPNATAPSSISLTLSALKASTDDAPYSYTISASMRPPVPPPLVSSIIAASTDPTRASSVSWTVNFNRNVSFVDSGDFVLAVSGLGGTPAVTGVSGSGSVWTVTASTGTGDGTLGLNLVDNDTIVDSGGKKLGGTGAGNGNFTGFAYTVDRTAPTVVIAQKVDPDDPTQSQPDPAPGLPIVFTITFSEPVFGFDQSDVTLTGTAPRTSASNILSGSRADYELAVYNLSGPGTVIASMAAGVTTDAAGNSSVAFLATDTTSDHTVNYTATQASTTTSLTSSPNPSVINQAVTYTATVSVNAPGTGTPTGNVAFYDGGIAIGPCGGSTGRTLIGPTATCSVTYTSTGSHTVTARYLGTPSYAASPTSNTVTQTVNATAPPVVTITTTAGSGHRDVFNGTTTVNTGTITVKVYAGASATGTPVKTYTTTTISGTGSPYSWTITTTNNDLTQGQQYTAQVTQVDGTGLTSNQPTVTFSAH